MRLLNEHQYEESIYIYSINDDSPHLIFDKVFMEAFYGLRNVNV